MKKTLTALFLILLLSGNALIFTLIFQNTDIDLEKIMNGNVKVQGSLLKEDTKDSPTGVEQISEKDQEEMKQLIQTNLKSLENGDYELYLSTIMKDSFMYQAAVEQFDAFISQYNMTVEMKEFKIAHGNDTVADADVLQYIESDNVKKETWVRYYMKKVNGEWKLHSYNLIDAIEE